jgi:hypothetical protein
MAFYKRFGLLAANETLVTAALIAAFGASTTTAEGFRPTDVRFFFFLFSNWIERDVLHQSAALELTQVRRLLASFVARRWVRARPKRAARYPRYGLTREGLRVLIERLASAVEMGSFEEVTFVVTFASCYGEMMVTRVARSSPEGERLRSLLDPHRLIARARHRLARVVADLEERVSSSASVASDAARMRARGSSDEDVALRLERLGAYQLQHVRSFAEFALALPPDLRAFELGAALDVRSRLLFVALADQARAQASALDRLDQRIAELTSGPRGARGPRGAGTRSAPPARTS